ncbi:MAG TPA: hypothetical protein P5268_08540 [Candidatus Marinimicrobia bacterium]|nr:hypothetical protein [Candidatus Neomarinimicrobiota bacterium]HRS51792.1 hypothetical protein [Candidatus Neomarinimicrobiota bacterium]HRU93062.1 hypothetical protein [Candidatus Neomarinimicrobiota bacterium]
MKKVLMLSFGLLFATFLNAADSTDAKDPFDELKSIPTRDTLQNELSEEEGKSLDEIVEDENWKSHIPLTDWDWNWNWKENDKEAHRRGQKYGYFRGAAGGWDIYYLPLNLADLNSSLNPIGVTDFDKYMILNGGGGWAFLGKSIRIGGLGAGGEMIAHGKPGDIQKEVKLAISFGGFTIDKVVHPFSKTELYLGLMIGGGNASIDFYQHGSIVSWDSLIAGYTPNTLATSHTFHDYSSSLSADYFTLMPTVGFRYNVFRWFAVGGNVGYIYTRMDQKGWRMDHHRVEGVPDLDLDNVIYRFNFYFGG